MEATAGYAMMAAEEECEGIARKGGGVVEERKR